MTWLAVLRYITELFICMNYFHGFESLPETIAIGFILHISVCRKNYGVDRGAVLPNLTKGSCGKPLVKEAFHKMLHQLVKSMFILPHSLINHFFPFPPHAHSTEAEIETPGLRTHYHIAVVGQLHTMLHG